MHKGRSTTNLRQSLNLQQSLGRAGETIARDFLTGQGWTIEAVNYFAHRLGEIDIIGRPACSQVLVFVEVKTRQITGPQSGLDHPGQQAVHKDKQRRMTQSAINYLSTHCQGEQGATLRFDLILVDIKLNYRDLQELLRLQDFQALKAHCTFSHIKNIMGTF